MRRRILSGYLLVTVCTLVVLVLPLGRSLSSGARAELLDDIGNDAVVVAGLAEDALESGTVPELDAFVTDYARDTGGRVVVLDASGRSVVDSAGDPTLLGEDFTNRPEIRGALTGTRVDGDRVSSTAGERLYYAAVPVASGGEVHGVVRITYPGATLDERVRNTWIALGTLSALVLGVVGLLGVALARLVSDPVGRLTAAARRIAAGDLTSRAPVDTAVPELRDLAIAFNETADRLQALLDAQAAFVADASHQLRTPLAAMRLRLENLEATVPSDARPGIAAALAEVGRLGRISEALLALSRTGGERATPVVEDLGAAVRERAEHWSALAAESDVRIAVDAPKGTVVRTSAGAIPQIVDNLVDNALDVAPPGSTITLQVVAEDRLVRLHVVDEGPGLTADHRARAIDRFWRGPAATPGGTGLGLAIVAELAGPGRLALEEAPGGGIDAVVTFDAAGTFT